MIRRALNFIGLAAMLTCNAAVAGAEPEKNTVIARLVGDFAEKDIQLSIVEHPDKITEGGLIRRKAEFVCLRKCNGFQNYSFKVDDFPLGIYRPIADGGDLITVWVGGTSFHVIVYRVGGRVPFVVLDKYSKIPPALSVDDAGIRIELSDTSDPPFKYTHRCVWHDEKTSYGLSRGNPKTC